MRAKFVHIGGTRSALGGDRRCDNSGVMNASIEFMREISTKKQISFQLIHRHPYQFYGVRVCSFLHRNRNHHHKALVLIELRLRGDMGDVLEAFESAQTRLSVKSACRTIAAAAASQVGPNFT